MIRRTLQKTNTILIFCFLVVAGLYFAAPILITLTFGIFLATLVLPLCRFLEHKGAGRLLASFLSTFFLLVAIGIVLFFLIRQLGVLLNDLIDRREEIVDYINILQKQLVTSTGFSIEEQENIIKNGITDVLKFLQGVVSGFLAQIGDFLFQFLLTLIYVFLLLINRDKFERFLMMYVSDEKKEETREIIGETQKVAYKYLWGRVQVMLLLGVMYTITFLSYGLEHAWLLIIFGVIITIIPYIGPLLSGVFPILFMIIFGGSSLEIFSFALLVVIIQLIESYVLEPVIIGSEVQQSPLFVIIAVIVGGAIWGIAGLILFVPIFGILKIIFDHTRELKPLGFLIGYERPGSKEGFIEKTQKKIRNK